MTWAYVREVCGCRLGWGRKGGAGPPAPSPPESRPSNLKVTPNPLKVYLKVYLKVSPQDTSEVARPCELEGLLEGLPEGHFRPIFLANAGSWGRGL